MLREIWKDIVGYEGLYEVSNLGRVKSVERVVEYTQGAKKGKHIVYGRIKNLSDNGRGYKTTSLYCNGSSKIYYVHRLVARAFLDNFEHKEQVNHIDFNRANNRVDNLEWVTALENNLHSLSSGRRDNSIYQLIKVHYTDGKVETYPSLTKASKGIGCHRDTLYGYFDRGYSPKLKQLGIIQVIR